jgi:serine O-acetyltransferase
MNTLDQFDKHRSDRTLAIKPPPARERSAVYQDIKVQFELLGGRSRLRKLVRCLLTPGVQAVIAFRLGTWLIRQPTVIRLFLHPVYALFHTYILLCWGIDIERGATIGPGLYIGHFGGINISGAATIGRNCFISQGITVGVSGQGSRRGAPVIGDNVYIAPGARIFGKINIGNDCKIGANCVVHTDIPDGATVVTSGGCEILSIHGERVRGITQDPAA